MGMAGKREERGFALCVMPLASQQMGKPVINETKKEPDADEAVSIGS
jgi:endonuclease V-like protein UPF0215 family